MTSPPVTVHPETSFAEIVEVLLHNDVSGVPVVDGDGCVVGMVTEADLVSKEAYRGQGRRPLGLIAEYLRGHDPQWVRKAQGTRAAEIMSAAVTTAAPDDDLDSTARTMLETQHKRLPVVENGRIVGVVSRHDLLKPFDRDDAAIGADVDHTLASPLTAPDDLDCHSAVEHGVVILTGTAKRPSDARVIGAMVATIPGVVAVENLLTAREREPRVEGR